MCLSGESILGKKKEISKAFNNIGAKVSGTVTKKTDVLVVGSLGDASVVSRQRKQAPLPITSNLVLGVRRC